jgi:hypothetical protein
MGSGGSNSFKTAGAGMMSWWKRLKAWQKGGVVLGGAHIFVYSLGLIIFGSVFGYFVLFLEYPWVYLYHFLHFPGELLFFPADLLLGTVFYALMGAFCGWVVSLSGKRNL